MKRWIPVLVLAALAAAGVGAAQGPEGRRPLRIVFVDVEGGAATLMVTPLGESVLVDTGWPGFDGRDPERIRRAARAAGVERIDHLVSTHWHVDHYGGLERLAELMPVGRYYDRGIPERLPEDPNNFPKLIAAYRKATRGQSVTLKPGDRIPLRNPAPGGAPLPPLSLTCLAASGEVVPPEAGAAPNPECDRHPAKPEDTSDNAKSIALRLDYGPFQFLNCGDLTWNVEHRLVCPTNRIGTVDLFQVTHHGSDSSNHPALVRAIHPRVAVICNGPRKGAAAATFATLRSTPGLEAIFQLHRNVATGAENNAPPENIANLEAACEGHPIRAEVAPDGRRYTVTVEGRGTTRTFETR